MCSRATVTTNGRVARADETLIPRSELIAVIARGPRGDPTRRLETHAHAVVIDAGVYRFGGLVHAPAGVDAEQRLRDGGPMVPLTEAWLQYRAGERCRHDSGKTVIVNCGAATRIVLVNEPAPPDRPPS